MPNIDASELSVKPFAFEKHAAAIGAVAAVTSTAASPFMSDYRTIGYILAGASILLSAWVGILRNMDLPSKRLKWFLTPILAVACGSLGLLGWSFFHPHKVVPPQVQAAPLAPPQAVRSDSHDTVKITTSGKNSPVINGNNAPIYIGDQPSESAKKRK